MTYLPNFFTMFNSIVKAPVKALILIGAILSVTLPQADAQITIDAQGYTTSSSTNNYMSTAIGPNGELCAAWKHNDNLYVGEWNGSSWVTANTTSQALLGASTWNLSDNVSLAVDANGDFHMAVRAINNNVPCCAQPRGVIYVKYDGSWSASQVEIVPGSPYGTRNPSIALSPSGNPEIVYEQTKSSNDGTGYQRFHHAVKNGSSWTITQHQTTIRASHYDIEYPNLKIDANGHRHVSYMKNYQGDGHDDLWYGTDASGTWVFSLVNAGTANIDNAAPSDLILDNTGNPIIANDEDGTGQDVNLYIKSGSSFTLSDPGIPSGGSYPNMDVNDQGHMVILYQNANNSLSVAYNTGSGWNQQTIASPTSSAGTKKDISINDNDEIVVFYHSQISSSDRRVQYLIGTLPGGGGTPPTPNNAPVINAQSFNVNENSANGTLVGLIAATDADTDPMTFSIISGNIGSAFNISNDSLFVNTASQLNYEQDSTYTLTVVVNDGTDNDTADLTVKIKDVNDLPVIGATYDTVSEGSTRDLFQIPISGLYFDEDGDSPSAMIISSLPAHGHIMVNGSPAIVGQPFIPTSLTYTPDSAFVGADSFTWNFNDSEGFAVTPGDVFMEVIPNTAPVVSNDYMTVAEDQSIVLVDAATHVLFTDADGDDLVAFRVDSLPNYGTLAIGGTPLVAGQEYTAAQLDSIEYAPGADLNGFDRMVWNASDGQAYAATAATITFEITPVNDAPVVHGASVQATEDLATHIPSQFTGAIFTDVDGDTLHTFQLVTEPTHGQLSVQGTNLSVGDTISGAQATLLLYTPDANYSGSDAFQWNGSDGQAFAAVNATVTIDVTPANDAPSAVLLNGTAIDENLPAGSVVSIFSATDVDAGDTHSFALIAGTGDDDNVRFVIVGDTLKTAQVIDFESTSRLSILAQASDRSGSTVVSSFQIDVNDLNDAPSTLVMATTTVDENATIGTIVSDVYAFDQDAVDDYTVTLVNGAGDADNASFAISGKNLVTNTTFDYNAQQVYNVRLRATDNAGAWIEGTFAIAVIDNNSLPTDISLSSATIQEDQPVGSFIGTLSATDADQVDTHTFALVSGTGDADNASFSINGDELLTAASFDFEDRSSYSVRISTTDGAGASFEKVFTITVTNLNDAPTAVALSNNVVAEDATVGTVVGTLSATDVDVADVHTFSLVQGTGSNDNVSFSINGDQLVTNTAFDFETKDTYSIRVRATDNGNASVEQVFTVSVTDVNDAPTNVTVTVLNVNENSIVGSTIGFINATDLDTADSHTFTLVSGIGAADNASFSILTNKLQVNDNFDFETKGSYNIRIRATDNAGASVEKAFTVTINDVNEVPSAITEQVVSLTENMPNGTVAASLATTDVDAGDSHSYALVSGTGDTDNALFAVSGDDIVVNGNLNWEAQSSYSVRVATYDQGSLSVEKVITINITDINDAPTGVTLVRSTTSGSTITYSAREFRSVSADEDAGDALVSIRIDALPQFGTLYLKKDPIMVGTVLALGDLSNLLYEAPSNFAGTDNFMWSPSDGATFADAPATAIINISLSRVVSGNTLRNPISMNTNLNGILLTQASATNNRLAGDESFTAIDEVVLETEMNTFPNPFSASTNIKFTLAADQQVEVQVYDLLGRNIKQLADGEFNKGEHNIAWDANDIEQGKYIIQFIVKDLKGNVTETKTTTVVKL